MDTARQSSVAASMAHRGGVPRLSLVTQQKAPGTMPTSEELKALVHAVAASGDRQAFAALFKHFAPRVKTYLMRAGSADALAEELAQETMITVWRKATLFDAGQAAVSTWIFTIARNLRVDQFRRMGGRASDIEHLDLDELVDPCPTPEDRLHAERRERGVRDAMARLSEDQLQVLRLSLYEEHPHARIAKELGIPLGTVKSRVRLAVNHLRRMLDGSEP